MTAGANGRGGAAGIPKLLGGDIELGNFILGREHDGRGTCADAARALIAEIDGVHGRAWTPYARRDAQDRSRRFLPANGGCYYIDSDHAEAALPEVRSAADYVAATHAMLRIGRAAMHAANARLPNGERLVVLANNTDGRGHSYGSHLNVLVTRRAWDDMFVRRIYPDLFWLAALQASSIVLTGQGKVGAENGRPPVAYQIAQRADFFECVASLDTMVRRPLANTRDEPHTDAGARLHCIFYDQTLCHTATFLRAGIMQLALATLETDGADADLILEDPVAAVHAWSHDPSLRTACRLAAGGDVTAVELQLRFLERIRRGVDAGVMDGIVPDACRIVELWADTLDRLERRDFDTLAYRLDWVRKKMLIERAMDTDAALDWGSPEVAHLDKVWSSLDENEGMYWGCERAGLVDCIVADAAIDRFVHEPPADTRARVRASLLRRLDPRDIVEVDWSFVRVRARALRAGGRDDVIIELPDPLDATAAAARLRRVATPSGGRAVAADDIDTPPPRTRWPYAAAGHTPGEAADAGPDTSHTQGGSDDGA